MLGIIGGLGPEATVYFQQLLINYSHAKCDQDHVEYILHCCPQIPDRTNFLLNNTNSPYPMLKELVFNLKKVGCTSFVMPCITAHYFVEQLKKECDVEFIDALDELCIYLKKNNYKKIGLLATSGTIASKILQDRLEKYDLECFVPNNQYQELTMDIIYNQVKKGLKANVDDFINIKKHLFCQGCDCVVLGCTELSILKRDNVLDNDVIDVLDVLALSTLRKVRD